MVATANHPVTTITAVPVPTPSGEAARDLALGFLRYASACWRGEECARWFAVRLGAYWRPQLSAMPARTPDAFSPHGAGGHGIAWFQTGEDVLGYIPDCGCGYQVPIAAIPGLMRCASGGSGERQLDTVDASRVIARSVDRHGAAA